MSAILSADDLNDFISPGVACIKPVETLPAAPPKDNPYEVVLEDKVPPTLTPAQISLTDCLACSGCVTSAEAVLVSLQSHNEVLANLASPSSKDKKFIALVSPQTRASLAVTYGVTEKEAGWMIEQLLCGSSGIRTAKLEGENGHSEVRGFDLVLDTSIAEEIALHYAAEEFLTSLSQPSGEGISKKKPILTSACPGFVCYLESTQPFLIPHLSTLKSPQAILGTAVKTLLQPTSGPSSVYVIGIMPCFDKKLEGARGELTSAAWRPITDETPVRDVDCVITTRELISLAQSLNLDFSQLPRKPLPQQSPPTGGAIISLLNRSGRISPADKTAGTSGGYLTHIVSRLVAQTPGAQLRVEKGRNVDTVDYVVFRPSTTTNGDEEVIARLARCYGFRNIQNLVRRLKPVKARVLPRFGKAQAPLASRKVKTATATSPEYAYVEVMACPGGCTNGGGQVKFNDEIALPLSSELQTQKEWVAKVDEAYYSAGEEEEKEEVRVRDERVEAFVNAWETKTGISREKLLFTGYRQVENDLGKTQEVDVVARAAELAMKAGGGW